MGTMRDLFEGFNVNQAMMMAAAAGSRKMDGLAGRVQSIEQAYANLEASDPKQGKEGQKLLSAVEAAVQKAEAFLEKNVAPTVRLIYASPSGAKQTIIVTGSEVVSHMGTGSSGLPMSLGGLLPKVRNESQGDKFRDALISAYRKSGGDAQAVLRAAVAVSKTPRSDAWSVKKY